jgi:hypothetical protein
LSFLRLQNGDIFSETAQALLGVVQKSEVGKLRVIAANDVDGCNRRIMLLPLLCMDSVLKLALAPQATAFDEHNQKHFFLLAQL